MEYSYNLREGEEEIIDVYRGRTKLIVEFRVKFVVKGREAEAVEVDSERYGVAQRNEQALKGFMGRRLSDYRMPHDQVRQLINEALLLLFRKGRDPPRVVVVDLEVSTLQLEGEDFNSTLHRALRPDYLAPLNHKYGYEVLDPNNPKIDHAEILIDYLENAELENFLYIDLPFATVPVNNNININGKEMMYGGCGVCGGKPFLGSRVSTLRCGHAFHHHCILRRLREVDPHCPICHLLPYNPTTDPHRYPKPNHQQIRLDFARLTDD